MPASFGLLFSATGLAYGLLVPLLIAQMFALFLLPCMMKGGRPQELAKAVYCYMAQTVGILLMTIGGLSAMISVLGNRELSGGTYVGLLFVFAVGGIAYLYHDNMLATIDAASRSVAEALFHYTWKFIALLIVLFASLSFLLELLLQDQNSEPYWWVTNVVLIFYGVLLAWSAAHSTSGSSRGGSFQSSPMASSVALSTGKKVIKKKK